MRSIQRLAAMAAALPVLAAGCATAPGPPTTTALPPEPPPPESLLTPDARYDAAAAYSAARTGHALLIVENGKVVYETGQNGHDARSPHALGSGTASFWGVLAAAADDDDLLDLDTPVAELLPEFDANAWKREMRVRELLHYTSGLEGGAGLLRLDPSVGEPAPDLFARALTLEMVAPPGERFGFGPSHVFIYAETLRRRLQARGKDPDPVAYLERRLLDPIGLRIADWSRDAVGNADVAAGASLKAREWAKFGELIVDGGRSRGERVIDDDALEECLEGSEANRGFGFALWLNAESARPGRGYADAGPAEAFHPGGPTDSVMAIGEGNQRLYVVPSRGLVVVRFGAADRHWRDSDFLGLLLGATAAQ